MVGKVFSFSRQRGYGLFASTHRAETIARVHQLLGLAPPAAEDAVEIDPAARYAAARPNTCPVLHSAPHASAKAIVNATQSKPISQTCGHNNLILEPRRLPHTPTTAIKSP